MNDSSAAAAAHSAEVSLTLQKLPVVLLLVLASPI
jgi:hypothetical protein